MILGTKARYAVMAMVEMAGRDNTLPISLADLAKSQEITVPYLEQIFRKLKMRKLVHSVRGPGGGYVLARGSDSIYISEIVTAVDESLKMTRCDSNTPGCMFDKSRCLTHDLWEGLGQQIYNYLAGISLADVRNNNKKKKSNSANACLS
jgi:Rrf2 family iron-sulfur cluster assembly transcriptional regulator